VLQAAERHQKGHAFEFDSGSWVVPESYGVGSIPAESDHKVTARANGC